MPGADKSMKPVKQTKAQNVIRGKKGWTILYKRLSGMLA